MNTVLDLLQDEISHMSSVGLAVPTLAQQDGISNLASKSLIQRTRHSDAMGLLERAAVVNAIRRYGRLMITAIRLDSYEKLVLASATACAALQLTQHNWAFESDVADVCAPLLQCDLHCPDFANDAIRARNDLMCSRPATLPGETTCVPLRVELLTAAALLGVTKRLERDVEMTQVGTWRH